MSFTNNSTNCKILKCVMPDSINYILISLKVRHLKSFLVKKKKKINKLK